MQIDNRKLSQKIKKLCKIEKISVSFLLAECGLNKDFIYQIETRGQMPSIERVNRVADYLNCSVDYLLGRTDIPNVLDVSNIDKNDYEYREGFKQGYIQACEDIKDKINDLTKNSFTERG